jgi:hypothetical protein
MPQTQYLNTVISQLPYVLLLLLLVLLLVSSAAVGGVGVPH